MKDKICITRDDFNQLDKLYLMGLSETMYIKLANTKKIGKFHTCLWSYFGVFKEPIILNIVPLKKDIGE